MQKTESSSSTTTITYRGQRDLHSRFQKRNSTHRRQGDLLEMHPCVPRTFQSFMTFQPFQAILQVPVSPGNSPHYSILQLECIFYSSIGFHRKLHRVPVGQYKHYKLQTLHSSKKGRCCDIGHVGDIGDIADMPIGRNAILVGDVEDITKMSR